MNLNEYQDFTKSTVIYGDREAKVYTLLGLLSEVGEIAQHFEGYVEPTDDHESVNSFAEYSIQDAMVVGNNSDTAKKRIRDKKEPIEVNEDFDFNKLAVAKELGDLLYYLARLAAAFGYTLEEIAQINVDKLSSRMARNAISGSGDNR